MTVPYSFGTATSAIPLSQLDSNFNTPITLGNTAIQLGNTVTTLNNMTLANVTISSGNVTLTNVSVTTANVATANIATSIITSSETLSYGTANGVAYLNGSKVVTTGSALAYDGTTLKVQNNNAVTPVFQIQSYSSVGTAIANITYDQGTDIYKFSNPSTFAGSGIDFGTGASSTTRYHIDTGGTSIWSVGGSESMRLTSTGLGIGTSSPGSYSSAAYNLVIAGTGQRGMTISSTDSNQCSIFFANSTVGAAQYAGYLAYFHSNNSLAFATNSTERMRLDSSGNLGLGVTPSAWGSAYKAIQLFFGGGPFTSNAGAIGFTGNCFHNGTNWIYSSSNAATRYELGPDGGNHRWFTAPSGTAGNAISFTQAMTLDANGRLFVGTTSGATKLDVRGTSNTVESTIQIVGNTVSSLLLGQNADGGVIRGQGGNDALTFWTGGSGDTGAGQSGSERARIDSSGNLLVGTTSTGYTNSNDFKWDAPGKYLIVDHASGVASGTGYILFGYGGGGVGSITQNGTTGVLYNITSDYRLKDVVGAVTGFGERIDALKPVDYTWKADGSAARGFLAHEFKEVYANSVSGEKDAVDDDGKPVYQQMQASTTEVIADLVAEIQSLRKRLAALEAK